MTERREAIRDAREQRHEDWQMRPPTKPEFLLGALSIQDDVSWFVFRDDAVRQGYSDFEADYDMLCIQLGFAPGQSVAGRSPARVHNVAEQNQWGYKAGDPNFVPGVPCTFGLVWSGFLFQSQIEALNQCIPLEVVLAAGGAAKETLRAVAEKLKPPQA